MTYTIITNHQQRELLSLCELPDDAREWFDYLTGEDSYSRRFVQYRGEWYDVNDSEYAGGLGFPDELKQWDGIQTESFFSGVLFKYSDDYEHVIVARYYC
jgi:hypothetical protein